MKSVAIAVLCLGVASGALLRNKQTPEEVKLDMEYRTENSFGETALEPACSKIECGEYECPTPFELKVDKTCCGYCWAPDHEVNVDRHKVVAYNATGFAVEQCESAPSTCKGPGPSVVRCFKPNCRAGDVPNCAPDACCPMCA